MINAKDLLNKDIPPVEWIVKDILPTGLTILSSRPKMGKSFLVLNLAASVASGRNFLGKFAVVESPVLLISNEDNERRLKNRLSKITSQFTPEQIDSSTKLEMHTDYIKLDLDGLKDVYFMLFDMGAKLVIIDTFGRAVNYPSSRKNAYFIEYEIMGTLHEFALANDICLLLVHHTRKQQSNQIVDSVLGTSGISGGADTLWIMDRNPSFTKLEIIGKDVEPVTLSLNFDKDTYTWSAVEREYEIKLTPEREEIYQLLLNSESPMELQLIAQTVGKQRNNVNLILKKLIEIGLVEKVKTGLYRAITTENNESTEDAVNDESAES